MAEEIPDWAKDSPEDVPDWAKDSPEDSTSTAVATPHTDAAIKDASRGEETLPQQLSRVLGGWFTGAKPSGPAWMRQRASAEAAKKASELVHAPSPEWLHPFERTVREVATTPALPSPEQIQAFREQLGLPDQPASGSRLAELLYRPIQKNVTLQNAAIAASWVQPEIGAAVTSAALAPAVKPTIEKLKQLPQMSPEQGLEFGMEFWPIVTAPFIHGPEPEFTPVTPAAKYEGLEVQPDQVKATPTAPSGPIPFTPRDFTTQETLANTQGMFTDESLANHFPNHELDELKAMGVISDAPNGNYFVNPVGTPAPERTTSLSPEQQAVVAKTNAGLEAGETPELVAEPVEPEPAKSQKELDDDARLRLEDVEDRLGIYGVTPHNTEGMTLQEAAKVLEAQEARIPLADRHGSIKTGKTIQENKIAEALRDQFVERQKGRGAVTDLNKAPVSFPEFDVTSEEGGGHRVRVSPYEEMIEVPGVGKGARPTFQRRTVPAADLFLTQEGDLVPYASRKRSTEKVGVRGQGKGVGKETPLRQPGKTTETSPPGTQPESPRQRPVAGEAPGTEASRYVVRETPKGAVVKDLQTNKNVASYESTSLRPDIEELATLRQKAASHAETLSKPKDTFRVRAPKDEFANSPETPVSTAISSMGGILSKSTATKRGRLKGNEALWNDLPKLSDVSHNKIYSQGGEMPDVMAQNLYDAGLITEPSVDAMYRAVEAESQGVKSKGKAERVSAAERKTPEKQAESFGKEQRKEADAGTPAVPASSLQIGDVVNVGGHDLKVTDIDPDDFTVTLENGKKYGVQQVSDNDVIYGELQKSGQGEAPKSSKPAPPPGISVEPEGPTNLGAVAPGKAKGRTWTRKQTSPMRYQHRDTPDLWLEQNPDKGGYDAVDYRGGQRNVLEHFPEPDARGKAQRAYAHGAFAREEAGIEDTPARVVSKIDMSNVQGFQEAFQKVHGRDVTPEEVTKLKPIADEIKTNKDLANKATNKSLNDVVKHYAKVKDISMDDAVAQVKDAIEQATKPCKGI